MPEMDGEEVLERAGNDPALAHIPFIVVSAEHERAERCRDLGAAAVLPKPIRAEELLAVVTKTLEQARARVQEQGLNALILFVGDARLAVPLPIVESVVLHPACDSLPLAPFYMNRVFDLHGEPVGVLDLSLRLGLEHRSAIVDRKLVVTRIEGRPIALSADEVTDPEEFLPDAVTPPDEFAAASHRPLDRFLKAIVRDSQGFIPVLEPRSLLSNRALHDLERALGIFATELEAH
jgi:chemotaxis signal transduction protein